MSGSVSGPVTGDLDGLLATATAWRDQDPDDETRDELDRLVTRATSSDDEALADALAGLAPYLDLVPESSPAPGDPSSTDEPATGGAESPAA